MLSLSKHGIGIIDLPFPKPSLPARRRPVDLTKLFVGWDLFPDDPQEEIGACVAQEFELPEDVLQSGVKVHVGAQVIPKPTVLLVQLQHPLGIAYNRR